MTPALSYTFSPHYSADASLSIYSYRLAVNENYSPAQSQRLLTTHGDVGDTLIGLHSYFSPYALQNTLTASMTAPTRNRVDGLGTGRVTFDLRDRMERYVHQTGFILDLGGGGSSGLFNWLVMDESSTLGPIVHFQIGGYRVAARRRLPAVGCLRAVADRRPEDLCHGERAGQASADNRHRPSRHRG